nr:extensin-like [Quercus suber]
MHSQLTPPLYPETPSYPPTSSSAPTLPIDPPRTEPMTMIPTPGLYTEHHYPPTSSSSNPVGPPVGTDTPQPDTDVPDENPPPQPSPSRGRPQRAKRAPTCGTGGHKIGHKHSSMHDDVPKDDAPQPPPPPKHYTRVKKRKIGIDAAVTPVLNFKVEQGNTTPGTIKEESSEKQSTRMGLSTSTSMMPSNSVSRSITAQLESTVPVQMLFFQLQFGSSIYSVVKGFTYIAALASAPQL